MTKRVLQVQWSGVSDELNIHSSSTDTLGSKDILNPVCSAAALSLMVAHTDRGLPSFSSGSFSRYWRICIKLWT